MKKSQKGSVVVWLIAVILVLMAAFGTYIYLQRSQTVGAPDDSKTQSERASILSVTPSAAHPGDTITVIGTNLTGQDSLGISSVDSSGHETFYSSLWEGTANNESFITFTLPITAKKGMYRMYVEVPFTGAQPCDTAGPVHCNMIIHSTFTNEVGFTII